MGHRCRVPALEHLNDSMLNEIAIPKTLDKYGNMVYKKCSMFDLNYTSTNDTNELLSMAVENDTREIACTDGWVYDHSTFESTAFSQYQLVCDNEWMYTLPASAYMFGMLIGAFGSGALADRFGRKRLAMIMIVCHITSVLCGALIPHFYAFVVFRGLTGITLMGTYTPLWCLVIEMMPHTHRSQALIYTSLGRVVKVFLPVTAYFVRNHVHLQLISVGMAIPGLLALIPLKESPRWLLAEKRTDEANKITKAIAKFNRVDIDDVDDHLLENVKLDDAKAGATIFDLFKTPRLRMTTLMFWFIWFCGVFANYAMQLNVGTLFPGSIYLNMALLIGISDVPEVGLQWLGLFKFSRRISMVGYHMMCGLCIAAIIPIVKIQGLQWLVMVFAFAGNLMLGARGRVLYLYTGEVFPTPARNAGLGSASSFGRLGGLITPQLPLLGQVWYGLPYIVLMAFPILAGILSFFLPETKDRRLPETLEEAEQFGTSRWKEEKESSEKDEEYETKT